MIIPSLTPSQLEILRTAKQCSGKIVRLCYEIPITSLRKTPYKPPLFIQKLVKFGLIEIQSEQVIRGPSLFQKDSWDEYCADLELPSIRAWELWRKEFIASQQNLTHALTPGEGFEDFSEAWIQEIKIQAIQPS